MTNSRENILEKLRQGKRPFPDAAPVETTRRVVPDEGRDQAGNLARFVQEAEKIDCFVYTVSRSEEAVEIILDVIGSDTAVSCWDLAHIPIQGLGAALAQKQIQRVGEDASVRVGITGVDAGLAATGSVIVRSGNGRHRATSLLPAVHIAVLTRDQILPDLESWWAQQRAQGLDQLREASKIAIISGPSRTADIAMTLVLGMHGPRAVHLLILDS